MQKIKNNLRYEHLLKRVRNMYIYNREVLQLDIHKVDVIRYHDANIIDLKSDDSNGEHPEQANVSPEIKDGPEATIQSENSELEEHIYLKTKDIMKRFKTELEMKRLTLT